LKTLSEHKVEVFETGAKLDKAAAEYIITIAKKSILERGKFIIALSGGETPKGIYSLLAIPYFSTQIEWNKTFIFWGDERCVPLNDAQNNAHQAISILLNKVEIPLLNIHSIPVNLPPLEAARNYEKELGVFFGGTPPQFDLILLGLGENGHTASLFPGTKVIQEYAEGVRAVFVEEELFRITMTAPLINQAHHILFLVTGEKKAKVLQKILNASYQPDKYPAQLIKPIHGELVWFVDAHAASIIT
jgi:6-phosphogluconolactonase